MENNSYRQKYHFTIDKGWMNDPNGCIHINDTYHIFFQYNPYDVIATKAHWGHVITKDFYTFTNCPIALTPNMEYESIGCWSGSAIKKDDKLFLIYTNNNNGIQEQSIAVSIDNNYSIFKKDKNNPIIKSEILPSYTDIHAFRDPYVFKENETYYLLAGARDTRGYGKILLFKSEDLYKWEYINTIIRSNLMGNPGIFECPSIKKIGDKYVLIASINFVKTKKHKYQNFASTILTIGKLDLSTGEFIHGKIHELDSGFDYYAPQIFNSGDDRLITAAWMNMWERNYPTKEEGWVGGLSLPREISIKNKTIKQYLIKEFLDREEIIKIIKLIKGKTIINLSSSCHISFDLFSKDYLSMITLFECVDIKIDPFNNLIIFDRSKCINKIISTSPYEKESNIRYLDYKINNKIHFDIFLDVSSIEIFIDYGKKVLTGLIYPNKKDTYDSIFNIKEIRNFIIKQIK